MVQQRSRGRSARPALVTAVVVVLLVGCTSDDGADPAEDAGGTALTAADCQRYVGAFQQAGAVNDPSNAGAVAQVADVLDEGADQVPPEVSEDFRVMADAYRTYGQALQDMNTDFANLGSLSELDPEDLASLETASQALGTPQVQDAARDIDAFLTEHCT